MSYKLDDDLKAIRAWFKDYDEYRTKSARSRPGLRSPVIDGMPKGQGFTNPDKQYINHANYNNEAFRRECAVKTLSGTDERSTVEADLIRYRYMLRLSVALTVNHLYKYHQQFDDVDYYDRQFLVTPGNFTRWQYMALKDMKIILPEEWWQPYLAQI